MRICVTIGPSCNTAEKIKELVRLGADVLRINLSHTCDDELKRLLLLFKELKIVDRFDVAVETCGPEIRIGSLPIPLRVHVNDVLHFDTNPDTQDIFIDTPDICKYVCPGQKLYIDDGLLVLFVLEINGTRLKVKADNDHTLYSRKRISLQREFDLPIITDRDRALLNTCLLSGVVDWIFLSSVKTKQEVTEVRSLVGTMKLFSRIETLSSLNNVSEIIDASDGVVVPRGDSCNEQELVRLFKVQTFITKVCREENKMVVCGNETFHSMVCNVRPTRAEVIDLSYAVKSGCSCVMLCAETAIGAYPSETVRLVKEICNEMERS